MNIRYLTVLVGVLALVALPVWALAAGGVCVDDVRITNDGAAFFTDDFDGGGLAKWRDPVDASNVLTDESLGDRALHLNKHGSRKASVIHDLGMQNVGLVEVRARVLISPAEQQYEYTKNRYPSLEFWLFSETNGASARAIVNLKPGEPSNRLGICVQSLVKGKPSGQGNSTRGPVLEPDTWAVVKLRLDPQARSASVWLDNKQLVSRPYTPEQFLGIKSLSIICTYGDGSNMPQ